MQISLIITTYNWKEALRLSLQSVLLQTLLPSEIVVADDGSEADTAELLINFSGFSPIPIIHSWQKDKGYRLAKSRNRAIAKAKGEYILLIDGDMVLDPRFVADHIAFAQSGQFVQGPRALLGKELTGTILESGVVRLPPLGKGIGNRKNCLRSTLLARMFSFKSKKLSGIKLCNFAFWKQDAIKVNGFNEDFIGWGREDSEFVARLFNRGIGRQNLKFHSIGYHLHHPMNTRDRVSVNDRILEKTVRGRLDWCEKGIDQYLH
jgi:glycosyltransferase involved in cell wall biosynthesis